MEREKPYQPSEEEMQKAEEIMDDNQKEMRDMREMTMGSEGGEDSIYFARYGDKTGIRILEDGSIEFRRSDVHRDRGGPDTWKITPQQALEDLKGQLTECDRDIKDREKRLELAKLRKDKIGIMMGKIEKMRDD